MLFITVMTRIQSSIAPLRYGSSLLTKMECARIVYCLLTESMSDLKPHQARTKHAHTVCDTPVSLHFRQSILRNVCVSVNGGPKPHIIFIILPLSSFIARKYFNYSILTNFRRIKLMQHWNTRSSQMLSQLVNNDSPLFSYWLLMILIGVIENRRAILCRFIMINSFVYILQTT